METFYRRLLVCYPRRWRAEHADALLGVLLDVATAGDDRFRPNPAIVADVALHGLRTRASAIGSFLPSTVRDRAAMIALGSGSAISVVFLMFGEWRPAIDNFGHVPTMTPSIVGYLGWILALASAIVARPRVSRLLLVLTLVATVMAPAISSVQDMARPPLWLMLFLAMLCTVACLGRASSYPGARPQVIAISTAGVCSGIAAAVAGAADQSDEFYRATGAFPVFGDTSAYTAAAVAVAAALLLMGRRAWAGALAMNAIVWASLAILTPAGAGLLVSEAQTIAILMAAGAISTFAVTKSGDRTRPQAAPVRRS